MKKVDLFLIVYSLKIYIENLHTSFKAFIFPLKDETCNNLEKNKK